ncbi:MAG: lysophospholipid acyltransferase family protein [Planctomycetota bacterium]|jgi:KDO2-lipid IV(A) lauroyltransferase
MNLFRKLNRRYLLRYRLEYLVGLTVFYGSRCMSPAFAWGSARMLGRLVWRLGIRRKVAMANLGRAFPEWSEAERARTCRRSYEHFASVIVDLLFQRRMLTRQNSHDRVTLSGWVGKYFREHGVEGLRRRAHRILFMTAHLGNWEMGSGFFGLLGVKVAPVYRIPQNPFLARLVRKVRLSHQAEFIERRGAVQAMLERFERNENVGFLFDQEAGHGLDIPFFGHAARTHKTPAVLALDYDVKVTFGVMIRRGDFLRYELRGFLYEDFEHTGDRDKDLFDITHRLMGRLEEYIREYPEQYLWMHRRWKRAGFHG